MSSTATQSGPAPWRQTFLDHLSKMSSPELMLSTLTAAPSGSSTSHLPRARTCIYRGMWTELPENKHNPAEKNERVFGSDMPTITTDVRMEKVGQITGTGEEETGKEGSGGGGRVEAVWWIKEGDVMTQWRVKGEAFVIGPDVGEDGNEGVKMVKTELGKRMRTVNEGQQADWSWEKELTAHFGNLSPMMRGSFKAPSPGMPKGEPFDDKKYVSGQKVEDLHDPVARENFRLVVIRPDEVEQLYLGEPKFFRYRYTYQEDSGDWKKVELWP
ncbi:hypothetical protein K402DRAFT_395079 [Aulographum hederae CBS 113979]|uniref:Pyridoxamine 5'-phosphate oxidase Alr4036 family FMN-binding domain-containing protein n=1 Tax=Aulographum hederae CBS 113979 TaxID=1176131 RepID=A0A6G1GW48_9PEZI|nr:hypothetical protein K402DRAFT_395079 [Aulographum hederae CBS 113979]